MRLEEEDEKQRRKLENLKNKNHQLQDLKDEKGHREAEVTLYGNLAVAQPAK